MYVRGARAVVLSITVLAIVPAACVKPATPATSVLAGAWKVTTPSSPELTELLITFDSNGNLETVTYQLGNNATVTWQHPLGTTAVDGSDVTISATFNNNGLVFEGTLSSDNTVITGNVTTQITAGNAVVTINNGPATLTKQ
jgi:hypothetical protein